jgi:hypothetical protein
MFLFLFSIYYLCLLDDVDHKRKLSRLFLGRHRYVEACFLKKLPEKSINKSSLLL